MLWFFEEPPPFPPPLVATWFVYDPKANDGTKILKSTSLKKIIRTPVLFKVLFFQNIDGFSKNFENLTVL